MTSPSLQLGQRAAMELDQIEVVGCSRRRLRSMLARSGAGRQSARAPAPRVSALGEKVHSRRRPPSARPIRILAVVVALGRVDDVQPGVERAPQQPPDRAGAGLLDSRSPSRRSRGRSPPCRSLPSRRRSIVLRGGPEMAPLAPLSDSGRPGQAGAPPSRSVWVLVRHPLAPHVRGAPAKPGHPSFHARFGCWYHTLPLRSGHPGQAGAPLVSRSVWVLVQHPHSIRSLPDAPRFLPLAQGMRTRSSLGHSAAKPRGVLVGIDDDAGNVRPVRFGVEVGRNTPPRCRSWARTARPCCRPGRCSRSSSPGRDSWTVQAESPPPAGARSV